MRAYAQCHRQVPQGGQTSYTLAGFPESKSFKGPRLKTYEVNWPQIHAISFQLPSVGYEF